MNGTVRELGAVEVLAADGTPSLLGSMWAQHPILLAMIRHFG